MPKRSPEAATEHAPDPLCVDPVSAEALLTGARLGQRIKRLRLKRSMGLVELGKLTGLSASFLSQLETGRVVPTLRNLARIALVFNKDLSYFFESSDLSVFRIQRRRDRIRLPVGSPPDYISENLGILVPDGALRPCVAELLHGEDRNPFEPERYPGVEMVYVISGTVELARKGESHRLEANDLCYISAETPRSYRCIGEDSAQALFLSFDRETPTPQPPMRKRALV